MLSGEILITGPAGRIAYGLAESLVRENEVWGIARFSDAATREKVEALGLTTRVADIASGRFDDLPDDFTYLLHIAADFSEDDYDYALRVNAEGTGFLLAHCRKAKAALVMSTVTIYKPHPDPWHAFREEEPLGDQLLSPATYSISKIAQEAVARYRARAFDLPVTIARMGAAYGERGGLPIWHLQAIAAGQPVQTRWDPIPYSPIHDDDIQAQLEPLLDAASVPATIVNWTGDEPVSVQQWCAYFGELLGVEAKVLVKEIPGASRGSVGDPTKRRSITGPGRVHWKDGFRRMVERLHPQLPMSAARRYPTGEALMADAMQATGLSDFGPGDFREGLEVLLESFEHDADLSPASDSSVVADLKRRLQNRLEVEAWLRAHPEIEKLALRGPVDVNGLPRTGTTALANMLSLDPQFRCLRGWEQAKPCPPPILEEEASDPRRLAFARQLESVPAALKAMHLYDVDAAMEDTEILGMAFHGQQYTHPVYGYHAWWRGTDCTDTFAYHRRVVTLLQSRRPPDLWLFKAPHHKFHLEPITAAYPDVRFIMTHRDPAKVVPSYASLVSTIFPPGHGERDMKRLGREVSEHLRIGMQNAIAARARLGEQRFLDVHHRELNDDPMGTLQRVYAFLGLELRPEVQQALRDWQQTNRSGAHGTHRYTAEQFGLSTAQLHSDYDFYIRHFDVPVEG